MKKEDFMSGSNLQKATLASGCFWCTEAIFQRLKGVQSVLPGYTGGVVDKPDYETVSSGSSGHAEAIQIVFDATVINYEQLLDVFFHLHDPTTINSQGADIGTQYRSAIFYHDEMQKQVASKKIEQLTQEKAYKNPIVTELAPFTAFFSAEKYHQNYYNSNRGQGYCQVVIDPKIQKLMKNYSKLVK